MLKTNWVRPYLSQVDEGHPAEVPCFLDPSGHGHFFAAIGHPEFSASICPVHITLSDLSQQR